MSNKLENQVALVTGGSRGIGRAICRVLSAEGAQVIVHYHSNLAAAEETRALLGPRPTSLAQADLGSTESISHMVAQLDDGSVDVLVNNAGVWKSTPLGTTDEALMSEVLHTNLEGVFWLTQAMLPKLRDGARIVNISSVAGRIGVAGRSLYGAAKAGVDSLTMSWALELAPRRIRVNAIAPGFVETDMTAKHFSNPETRRDALSRHPLGGFATPEDVAKAVAFLCTDDASMITGQSLNVSGGSVL